MLMACLSLLIKLLLKVTPLALLSSLHRSPLYIKMEPVIWFQTCELLPHLRFLNSNMSGIVTKWRLPPMVVETEQSELSR